MAAMLVTQNTDFIASIELRIFFALGCAGIVESGELLYQWNTVEHKIQAREAL